jgi:hypothetical protein
VEKRQTSSSTQPDGRRSLYKEIWSTNLPLKVRVFAWRLAQEGLVTNNNRKRRTLMPDDTYQVCGCEGETGYHVVIRCTKAWALRQEMRHHWQLPDEEQFKYSRPDWLLHFLSSVASEVKARIVLLLWHAWDLRNDVVHAKGMATIMGSANFLVSYEESINTVTRPLAD